MPGVHHLLHADRCFAGAIRRQVSSTLGHCDIIIKLFFKTLPVFQRSFQVLEGKIEKPAFVKRGTYYAFRYEKQPVQAAVI